ncbi:hypothetical protein [Georgenia thermotolerans]|uniref:Uncharacterized protein n=1 Tax=Georgenia thermotolerans TaxID=527326 RepID=A0A7J5UJ91_9MICO|nr:hypothetical protein [Georgenia thermotolerans]KAE8762449.1 hypothetical protein GB883_19340 [Georgenia thermotolerans]
MHHDDVPTLVELAPETRTIAEAYFEIGRCEGWCAGYAAAEADDERRWGQLARLLRGGVPYDELCERRGEHARAVRHRALMRERGITA